VLADDERVEKLPNYTKRGALASILQFLGFLVRGDDENFQKLLNSP